MSKLNDDQINLILQKNGQASNKDMSKLDISLDEVDSFGNKESMKEMFTDIAGYNRMIKERMTFINDPLTTVIPFTRENLYLICAYSGNGKCFKPGTKILMYDGSVKKVEDVNIGDKIMGPDSKPRTVLTLASGEDEMYEVIPSKGDSYTVNSAHVLSLKYTTTRKVYKDYNKGDICNISVTDYINSSLSFKGVFKGYRTGVEFNSQDIGLDPYYVGLWLGDGTSESTGITTADKDIADYIYYMADKHNLKVKEYKQGAASEYRLTTGVRGFLKTRPVNSVLRGLQDLNLINNKHIPSIYKINDRQVRLQVLAGIIDSDGGGSIKDGSYDICLKNKTLADDVVFLARSLGFSTYIREVQKSCINSKYDHIGTYHRISISGHTDEIPVKLLRKQRSQRRQIKDVQHVTLSINPVGRGRYYGFSVDGDHLFLLEDFTVTHNSTIAANISYPLWKQDKKVLVIANEEPKQDVMFRIGCLELGLNFNDYKKGRMPMDLQTQVAKLFPSIADRVKILDVNYKDGLTTKVEGVKNALNAVSGADYSCVLIDYFQLIKFSVEKPQAKSYDVLNDLRIWLGQYIKRCNIPVVVFAQLHSIGKRANKDLDSRIKHCPDIYEPSTVVIEVVPNFNNSTSDFMIHKDRFGFAGQRVSCGFDRGRYVKLTDEFKRVIAEKNLNQLEGKIADEKDEAADDE